MAQKLHKSVIRIRLVVNPTLGLLHDGFINDELKSCTTTEIRWNENEDARTSPVVYTCRQLPNSLRNCRASQCIIIFFYTLGTKDSEG